MKHFFSRLLPHLVIILSVMILTFFVIDRFNEAMAFLNNDITKCLAALLALLSLILSVLCAVRQYREDRRDRKD